MPRVNVVPKSRKPVTCSHCRATIPSGSFYRWIKPRYGPKLIRCMEYACRFRPTDLSSAKIAIIYEAIENAEETISSATCLDDIQSALSEVASAASEVAGEYQDTSDSWAGGNGNEEFQGMAEACERFADELESWSFSGEDDEEEIRTEVAQNGTRDSDESYDDYAARLKDEQDEAWEQALEAMKSEAIDKLGEFEL